MASYIDDGKKLDWAFPFQRTGKFPLDRTAMFSSYADAVLYASGDGTDERKLGGTSYIGQVLTVYENDTVGVYVINENRGLTKLASGASTTEELVADLTVKIETKDNPDANTLKSYTIKQGTGTLGTINIPKDFLVKSAEVKTCETDNTPLAGLKKGDKYLDFVINTKTDDPAVVTDQHLYINLKDLTDVYTTGSDVNDAVKIDITGDNKISAEVNFATSLTAESDKALPVKAETVNNALTALLDTLLQSITNKKVDWTDGITGLPTTLLTSDLAAPDTQVVTGLSVTDGLITGIQTKQLTTDDISGFSTYVELSELTAKLEDSEEAKYAKTPVSESNKLITNADVEDILAQVKPVSGLTSDTVAITVTETDDEYQVAAALVKSYALDDHKHELLTAITDLTAYTTHNTVSTTAGDKITLSSDVEGAIISAINTLTGIYTPHGHDHSLTEISNLTSYTTRGVGTEDNNKITISADVKDAINSAVTHISSTVAATYLSASKFLETLNTYTESTVTVTDGKVTDATKLVNKQYVDNKIASLGDVMHFRSAITANENETDIDAIERVIKDPVKGDVVLLVTSTKEYVYDGTKWVEIGDQNLYATKANLEAETAARIAADQFLSTAIDEKIFIDGVSATTLNIQHISQEEFHQLVVDNELASNELYVISSENFDMYGEKIINLKDPTDPADAVNKRYVDALTISQLTWDIELDGGNAEA